MTKLLKKLFRRKSTIKEVIHVPETPKQEVAGRLLPGIRITKPSKLAQKHPASVFKTPSNPQATLLGCPGEVRNLIYEFLFVPSSTEEVLKIIQEDEEVNPGSQLLLTCRQIYEEAGPLARSNILIVPRSDKSLRCTDIPLPLTFEQAQRFTECKDQSTSITTLIIREQLHNISSYWTLPSGKQTAPFKLLAGITTVYVQLCICEDTSLLHGHLGWESKLVGVLETLLRDYSEIYRIVVYYCALRTYTSVIIRGVPQTFPRSIINRFGRFDVFGNVNGGEAWDVRGVENQETKFLITRTTESGKREIDIEFYNSSAVSAKKCVLA